MQIVSDKLSYSVKEAVAATSLKKSTIYNRIASGEIETTKIGRRTVIPAHSLRRLVGG